MKIAYDIKLMRPACPILQVTLGGDPSVSHEFNSEHWITFPTPDLRVYNISDHQLKLLVRRTHAHREHSKEGSQSEKTK